MTRWLRVMISTVIALATLVVGFSAVGVFEYASQLPRPGVRRDPPMPADALVVLTGGSKRLREGIALYAGGSAPKLFISGVHPSASMRTLLRAATPLSAQQRANVSLGRVAANTRGNVAETAAWAAKNDVHSIILATASYHMPRSLLEFSARAPQLRVIPYPVFPEAVNRQGWWHHSGTVFLLATECVKYVITRLLLALRMSSLALGK